MSFKFEEKNILRAQSAIKLTQLNTYFSMPSDGTLTYVFAKII